MKHLNQFSLCECFPVNMTHVALTIGCRPLQELMSLPSLSHRCGKRKPPYFPQDLLIAAPIETVLCQPKNNHFFWFPPCLFVFSFSVGTTNFHTPSTGKLELACPRLLSHRSTCARMNRKWRVVSLSLSLTLTLSLLLYE